MRKYWTLYAIGWFFAAVGWTLVSISRTKGSLIIGLSVTLISAFVWGYAVWDCERQGGPSAVRRREHGH